MYKALLSATWGLLLIGSAQADTAPAPQHPAHHRHHVKKPVHSTAKHRKVMRSRPSDETGPNGKGSNSEQNGEVDPNGGQNSNS